MLLEQLLRCFTGLIEVVLWLLVVLVFVAGISLYLEGLTGTGTVLALGAFWFVAGALVKRRRKWDE